MLQKVTMSSKTSSVSINCQHSITLVVAGGSLLTMLGVGALIGWMTIDALVAKKLLREAVHLTQERVETSW